LHLTWLLLCYTHEPLARRLIDYHRIVLTVPSPKQLEDRGDRDATRHSSSRPTPITAHREHQRAVGVALLLLLLLARLCDRRPRPCIAAFRSEVEHLSPRI
jgi:hypothetical protein